MSSDVLAPRGALRGMLLAAAIVTLWLAVAPATPDLAAQVYRVHLFANHGFALYDANWYGGHLLPAYSVLFPPLGALIGVRLAGALATAAAIVLFDRLARDEFGSRAWRGTVWFAVGAGLNLLSARLTFALGLAIGLGALLAARRGRQVPALALAFACPLASPLAGLFLAGAGAAWAIGRRRLGPVSLIAASIAPLLALQIAFPEGGTFPFPPIELVLLLTALIAGVLVLPPEQRVLRTGFALYAVGAVIAFLVPSPLGYNCGRLALIAVGPLLACALAGRRALLLAAAAPLLLFWSWAPSASDLEDVGGPSATRRLLRPPGGVPGAPRQSARPGRDPLHQAALGGRLRRPSLHARPRVGAPARQGEEPDLLPEQASLAGPRGLLRLAAGRRGPIRRGPRRAAGRIGPRRGPRDRFPPPIPGPGLALAALEGLRGP